MHHPLISSTAYGTMPTWTVLKFGATCPRCNMPRGVPRGVVLQSWIPDGINSGNLLAIESWAPGCPSLPLNVEQEGNGNPQVACEAAIEVKRSMCRRHVRSFSSVRPAVAAIYAQLSHRKLQLHLARSSHQSPHITNSPLLQFCATDPLASSTDRSCRLLRSSVR